MSNFRCFLCRLFALCAPVALVLSGGCSYYLLDGNGPRTTAAVLGSLPAVDRATMDRWEDAAFNPSVSGTSSNYVYRRGNHRMLSRRGTLLDDIPRILVGSESWRLFDIQSTRCLGTDSLWFIGPCFIGRHFSAQVADNHQYHDYLEDKVAYEDLMWTRRSSFFLGWGLLAFGGKNGRACMQIAWIPIPLWSVD